MSNIGKLIKSAIDTDMGKLMVRIAELETALDQSEKGDAPKGMWRFWSEKSQVLAGKNAAYGARIKKLELENAALKEQLADWQRTVNPWLMACFGPEIAADKAERNHRFLEEALELVQAAGCTADEAHQLVDYTFGRPVGDLDQEVGGVMLTLAALCLSQGVNMHDCGNVELARVWGKIDKIRAKQAAKPKHSPLPETMLAPKGG